MTSMLINDPSFPTGTLTSSSLFAIGDNSTGELGRIAYSDLLSSISENATISQTNDPDFGTQLATGLWARPDISSFTWLNQQFSTADQYTNGPLIVSNPQVGQGTLNCFLQAPVISVSSPSAPWTRTWYVVDSFSPAQYIGAGIVLVGTNGHIWTFGAKYQGSRGLYVESWNSPTSYNTTNFSSSFLPKSYFLQVRFDGTNLGFYYSPNGYPKTFHRVFNAGADTWVGGQPANTGLFVSPNASAGGNANGVSIQLWAQYSSTP